MDPYELIDEIETIVDGCDPEYDGYEALESIRLALTRFRTSNALQEALG